MGAHFIKHSIYLKIILIHLLITILYKDATEETKRLLLKLSRGSPIPKK